jgi:LDH2 family malate/lactate/ureidoglycolate dehydrogenase
MKVALEELKKITFSALLNQGYSETESEQILEVLLYAQVRGNNQGVVKLIGAGMPRSSDAADPEITRETPVSAVIDAHHTQSMIAVTQATDIAINKARTSGVAVVGVNHLNSSSGAIGYYAGKIAAQGLVGIVMGAGPETVAPAGATEAVFGTNPLAIGVPGRGEPVVLDITTAAMAFYGVVEAHAAGRQLPEGIAYDADGKPSTDPARVLKGALLPFDKSQRGSGLGMMIQLLAGPFVGAGSDVITGNWGHLILVIDPQALAGSEALLGGVQKIVTKTKNARKLDGVDEILVPGERGSRQTREVLSSGMIEIEDNLFAQLQKAAQPAAKGA